MNYGKKAYIIAGVVITVVTNTHAQTAFLQQNQLISRAKAERLRRDFNHYIHKPSTKNLSLARSIIKTIEQDESKKNLAQTMRSLYVGAKKQLAQSPKAPQTEPCDPSTYAHMHDKLASLNAKVAELKRGTPSINMALDIMKNTVSQIAEKVAQERIELTNQRLASLESHLKDKELTIAHLKDELSVNRASFEQTQVHLQNAIIQQQALAHQEQALLGQERESLLRERENVRMEREKNQKLIAHLQELQNYIHDERSNHSAIIAKLEERIKATEQHMGSLETIVQLKEQRIQSLKQQRMSLLAQK